MISQLIANMSFSKFKTGEASLVNSIKPEVNPSERPKYLSIYLFIYLFIYLV